MNTAVLNFPKLPCWPPGASRTYTVVPGPTRIATELHGGYTVPTRFTRRIVPDVIRVDPAPIWDWGFRPDLMPGYIGLCGFDVCTFFPLSMVSYVIDNSSGLLVYKQNLFLHVQKKNTVCKI